MLPNTNSITKFSHFPRKNTRKNLNCNSNKKLLNEKVHQVTWTGRRALFAFHYPLIMKPTYGRFHILPLCSPLFLIFLHHNRKYYPNKISTTDLLGKHITGCSLFFSSLVSAAENFPFFNMHEGKFLFARR